MLQSPTAIRLNGDKTKTFKQQIRDALIFAMTSGFYAPGDKLPSIRQAAKSWGVTTKTVHLAYQELHREGKVDVVAGGGYKVVESKVSESPESEEINKLIDSLTGKLGTFEEVKKAIVNELSKREEIQKLILVLPSTDTNKDAIDMLISEITKEIFLPVFPVSIDNVDDFLVGQSQFLLLTYQHLVGAVTDATGHRFKVVPLTINNLQEVFSLLDKIPFREGYDKVGIVFSSSFLMETLLTVMVTKYPQLYTVTENDFSSNNMRSLVKTSDVIICDYMSYKKVRETIIPLQEYMNRYPKIIPLSRILSSDCLEGVKKYLR